MKRSVTLLFFSLTLHTFFYAQVKNHYKFAFGLRAGSDSETCGIALKFFFNQKLANESIFAYSNGGIAFTNLVEYHFRPFQRKEISFYAGGGAHFNQFSGINSYTYISTRNQIEQDGGFGYGGDIVVGFEYKFTAAPIAVSIDFKPRIDFNQYGHYQCNIDKSIGFKIVF